MAIFVFWNGHFRAIKMIYPHFFSKNVFLDSKYVVIDENYFFYFKMAAWLQILKIVGDSTLFYLSFDTHDSPGSVFI